MSRVSSGIEARESDEVFRLILFVCNDEPNSSTARENLEQICATYIPGRNEIEIVDVLQDYRAALAHSILVTPCLLKVAPAPRALVAGTLHDGETVRTALQLPRAKADA
ncbi:MAG: circadian clock KaiB family protein [Halofilum sp. (in: g-proteobacteria)]